MFDGRQAPLHGLTAICSLWLTVSIAMATELAERIEAGADTQRLVVPGDSFIEEIIARIGLRTVRVTTRVLPRTAPRRTNPCENRQRTGYP